MKSIFRPWSMLRNALLGCVVAQLVKCPILVFRSFDLRVCEFEPRVGLCADNSEPGACFRFCVSLSLCPSPARILSLSLSQNKQTLNKQTNKQTKNPPTNASLSPAWRIGRFCYPGSPSVLDTESVEAQSTLYCEWPREKQKDLEIRDIGFVLAYGNPNRI